MSDNKKPPKGILKTSRSVDASCSSNMKPTSSKRSKEQRFDEMNIIETFHPANKDYGHMKVDEPKTPFSESVDGHVSPSDEVDANILAAKLTAEMNKPSKRGEPHASTSDEEEETEEERRHRIEFEKKRKMHYNEFQALQLAKQLMKEEEEEDDDDESSNKQNKK